MSNEDHSHPISQGGKNHLKNALKKESEKNETFYVKKRGLFRKAEQVVKYCNSEVFIIVHKKDSDKIFSFTSDKTFNLEKISSLVLRDVQQSAILQKNKKFQTEDFDKIMSNIKQI
jgi:molecular chaperone DnaK (HSP70)